MSNKENSLIKISESLKAIAHPDRINILKLLSQKNKVKLSVTEICNSLNLSQPETSRHLSILKNKEILLFERIGSQIFYTINKTSVLFGCIEKILDVK